MLVILSNRRAMFFVLCAGLTLITVSFSIPASFSPGLYWPVALIQFTITSLAAWKLGASAVTSDGEQNRKLAAAGALLVLPWILFSFLAGFSAPQVATAPQNELRYIVLLINSFAVAAGLIILRQALSEAGERFFSTLGFAAIVCALPLYTTFMSISIAEYREIERVGLEQAKTSFTIVSPLAGVALFFQALLGYLATACFAAALGKTKWLGQSAGRIYVVISLFAALCVGVKVAQVFSTPQVGMWEFSPWYTVPGTILSIPAGPWVMPLIIGVLLLKRAGDAAPQ